MRSKMSICSGCAIPYEVNDRSVGTDWFIVDIKVNPEQPFRIYVELRDIPGQQGKAKNLCPRCLVELLNVAVV